MQKRTTKHLFDLTGPLVFTDWACLGVTSLKQCLGWEGIQMFIPNPTFYVSLYSYLSLM